MKLIGKKAIFDFDLPSLRMSIVSCWGLGTPCIYAFVKDRPISDQFLGHCNPGQILRDVCREITIVDESE